MENFYSRLALDIIGKAVFNYDFDSLKKDDPVIKAVYTVLREAEYRSVTFIPYWKVPLCSGSCRVRRRARRRQCGERHAQHAHRGTRKIVEDSEEFVEEYMSKADPRFSTFSSRRATT